MMQKLSQKIQKIELSEEMKKQLIRNCCNEMEEKTMRKNKVFQKPVVAAASMAVCFCLIGVTSVFAANGKLEGFFKDIVRWDGAVIGTSYEQATDEITVSAVAMSGELVVTAELVKAETVPYKVLETLEMKEYKIVDEQGAVVLEGDTTESARIVEGQVKIAISIDNLAGGKYKLVIKGFVGSAKADQPLELTGNWECEFTY